MQQYSVFIFVAVWKMRPLDQRVAKHFSPLVTQGILSTYWGTNKEEDTYVAKVNHQIIRIWWYLNFWNFELFTVICWYHLKVRRESLSFVWDNSMPLCYGTDNAPQTMSILCDYILNFFFHWPPCYKDRLCGLVAIVLGYRSGGPGSIPGTTRKKK
jgi:hypothetical protein